MPPPDDRPPTQDADLPAPKVMPGVVRALSARAGSAACEAWQEAISAIADGEDPGSDAVALDDHVERCPACRAFRRALDLGAQPATMRTARADGSALARQVTRAVADDDRKRHSPVARALLAVVAIEILVFAVPDLVGWRVDPAEVHAARHLGAFTAAYSVGLLAVVARPARARTMLPVAAVVAAALILTALVDLARGEIPFLNEASHLPEVISVILVHRLTIPMGRGTVGLHRANSGNTR